MTMLSITAEIHLDDEDLDNRVLDAAAEKLLSQLSLTARYGGTVVDVINTKLSEVVMARVEALMDKEIARVDRYGDPVPGPRKTFRDTFADMAETYLKDSVDSDGRASSGGYSTVPRLEYLIRKCGLTRMEDDCRKIGDQFKKELQEKAKVALSSVVAEHLARAVK